MNKKFNMNFIILILLICVFFFAYFVEPYKLVINNHDIFLPNWNEKLDGLKVTVVSDLHIGTKKVPLQKVEKIVELINAQSPDIIIIPGDFDAEAITYSKTSPIKISETLSKLHAPYGVYAVMGNHDYKPAGVVRPILNKSSVKLLSNNCSVINIDNQSLNICGIEDIWHEAVDLDKVIEKASPPLILASHNPDSFPYVPNRVSLTISGHTHGGEINLPLLGAPFVPSVYGQKYMKGHIIEDNRHLFVTSGVASLSRMRLFNPPEIVVLNLYSDSKTAHTNQNSSKVLGRFLKSYNMTKYKKVVKLG